MNVTQLVFSWPREAQYSCKPDSYQGWAIEDYNFEISSGPLQIGDLRSWEEKRWTVAQIENYTAEDGSENSFRIALLTLDGKVAQRDPWDQSNQRIMYVCISPDDALFGLPEHSEVIPGVGSEVRNMPGWKVGSIREFAPDDGKTFDRIMVCWCVEAVTKDREPIAA